MDMKSILFTFFALFLSSCASMSGTPDLGSNPCTMSMDNGGSVQIGNDTAFYGAGCVTGRFGCKWKEAKWQGDNIFVEGELAAQHGKIASYTNKKFSLYHSDGMIAKLVNSEVKAIGSEPVYEFKKDRVISTTNLTGLGQKIAGKDKVVVTYMHSPTCTDRDVALGLGYFAAGTK